MKDRIDKYCDPCKVNDELGLIFGYAMVCKVDGEDYFDLQGDHIPEDTMLKSLAEFMESSREAKDMHSGDPIGTYIFAFPLTEEIMDSMGIVAEKSGAIVAMKPKSKEVIEQFKRGERTGFSIGGTDLVYEYVG